MTLGTVVTFQQAQARAISAQSAYAQSQSVTRTTIDLLSRELRMASYDPTNLALTPSTNAAWCLGTKQGIVEATSTRLRFRQDLDGSGVIDGANEDVTYALVGNSIVRTDGTGTSVTLVENVPSTGLRFRYFSGTTPPIEYVPGGDLGALTQGQRDCTTKIHVTISAQIVVRNANRGQGMLSLADSEIAIRNRSLVNF
jgi:hypothetical protein